MLLRTDIQLVAGGDPRLVFDPIGFSRGLTVTNRTADTGARPDGDGDTYIKFFAFDFAGVWDRRNIQVTADPANDFISP